VTDYQYIAPYKPLPWQVDPWRDKAHTLLLAGPAGTGKSRLAAEKLHGYMLKYPNSTGIALRKTRESMVNSTVLFLERTIIGRDPRVSHKRDSHRFEYANGSVLAYGGMKDEDQREQIRGIGIDAGVDIIWAEEAIKFNEDDFNEMTARMRGHAAPWQQIILATNPGPPGHWINQRLIIQGEAAVYDKARPEDNPYNPPAYIEGLQRLTGILRQRLWEGKWVQAEGLVYPEFDVDNITDEEPNEEYAFELGCDDGHIDPRAILFIQHMPDHILVFDEIYHSLHLVKRCVKEVLTKCCFYSHIETPTNWDGMQLPEAGQWCRENKVRLPEIAIVPPETKELPGAFREADIPARSADNKIVEGINRVRDLIVDASGYRTLRVNKRCRCGIKELTEDYKYPEGERRNNENPTDKDNHWTDGFRYWANKRGK
jgi:PBSX family phage terminase large subunit